MRGKSWNPSCGCPSFDLLARLEVPHWGFNGEVQRGQLIVAAAVADDVAWVFERLFAVRYPIERLRLIDDYGGSDERSMADNNSSAFNCRPKTGKRELSVHSFGRAIDLNPVQNPYQTRSGLVLPRSGARYANPFRNRAHHPAMIRPGDAVVSAFAAIGWRWGGAWSEPKDWQHFEAP